MTVSLTDTVAALLSDPLALDTYQTLQAVLYPTGKPVAPKTFAKTAQPAPEGTGRHLYL